MKSAGRTPLLLLIAVSLAALPQAAAGQGGLLDKVKQKTKERVDQKTDEAIDRTLDAVECALGDTECIEQAEAEGKTVKVVDEEGNEVPRPAEGAAAAAPKKPGEGAWANYDFVPGERILLAEDFTRDHVGDFPRRLGFQEGSLEIVEWEGKRYLRGTSGGVFYIPLPEALPERFTMEFDFTVSSGWGMYVHFDGEQGEENTYGYFTPSRGGLDGGGIRALGAPSDPDSERILRARIMADGSHVKVYLDEKRVANVPNARLVRGDRILVTFMATDEEPFLMGDIRIAAGGRKLYDALADSGRVATQGILFDTGSDRIRPESTPTLAEIGSMLKEHPELRLAIEGHTDDVGDAAANHALSEKRAAAVRAFLVQEYGLDGSRLEAMGFGETKPVAPNTTAEGRQQNRRVELVRL